MVQKSRGMVITDSQLTAKRRTQNDFCCATTEVGVDRSALLLAIGNHMKLPLSNSKLFDHS